MTVSVDDRDTATRDDRPETYVRCTETGAFVLRSNRDEHTHRTVELDEYGDDGDDEDSDGVDEDEEVGAYFDIRMDYSTTFSFRIPAVSKHEAEEIAKDRIRWGNAVDAFHCHTDAREIGSVTRDDLDDEWTWQDPIEDHLEGDEQ